MTMDTRIARSPPAFARRILTDAWTAPFWDAAARRELALPRCGDCQRFRMPPTPFCPYCRSQAVDWSHRAQTGVLYSYTIVDRATVAGMADHLPYVPAIVSFPDAGDVRLITNIVGERLGDIAIGQPVAVDWTPAGDGMNLPIFRLRRRMA